MHWGGGGGWSGAKENNSVYLHDNPFIKAPKIKLSIRRIKKEMNEEKNTRITRQRCSNVQWQSKKFQYRPSFVYLSQKINSLIPSTTWKLSCYTVLVRVLV